MSARTILYSVPPDETRRIVKRVQFVSPVALSRNKSAFYEVKVGVADGDKTDYIGTYTGAESVLSASAPHDITGADDISEPLSPGQALVADVSSAGDPPPIQGAVCFVHIGHDVGKPTGRDDDAVLEHMRLTGDGGDRFSVPLKIPDNGDLDVETLSDWDDSDQTVSTTDTPEAGNVAITVTLPAGRSTAHVQVSAKADIKSSSTTAGTVGRIYINDGSTSHNKAISVPAGTNNSANRLNMATFYASSLTSTTTFTLYLERVTSSGSGNAIFLNQLITALVIYE